MAADVSVRPFMRYCEGGVSFEGLNVHRKFQNVNQKMFLFPHSVKNNWTISNLLHCG